jgi:hypothetical protein
MLALGAVLQLLISEDNSRDKTNLVIERVSDAARLFADIHFVQSQSRRAVMKGALNKNLIDTLTEVSVDGCLFGHNLPD